MRRITVLTPNPPCRTCGGMGGYHYTTCDLYKLGAIADVILAYKPPEKAKATKAREKRRAKRRGVRMVAK